MNISGYEIMLGKRYCREELFNAGPGGTFACVRYRKYTIPALEYSGVLKLNGRSERSLRQEIADDIERCLLKRSGEKIGEGIW